MVCNCRASGSWFRKRRSAQFETEGIEPGEVRAKIAGNQCDNLPGFAIANP